ncbi:MAG: succinate dehydrogenase, hydrophobic membrane anchor protein [Pseudomonadales bacterium]|nr:succinate dehydrogenase, hydrophobic membrane anchor protein [Pseudomonadales bacterium]
MVTQVTGLSKNGVSDWYIQRASSVVMGVYLVLLLGLILLAEELTFAVWSDLFSQTWMQVATLLALIATCAHAWIGMWTIGTDYLQSRTMGPKGDRLRSVYQSVCVLALLAYVLWGVKILWGN